MEKQTTTLPLLASRNAFNDWHCYKRSMPVLINFFKNFFYLYFPSLNAFLFVCFVFMYSISSSGVYQRFVLYKYFIILIICCRKSTVKQFSLGQRAQYNLQFMTITISWETCTIGIGGNFTQKHDK